MKRWFLFILILLLLNSISALSIYAESGLHTTPKYPSTQFELNQDAGNRYKQADDKLNEVYNQVLSAYWDDPEFINKIINAQLAWITFRDAEMEALYPEGKTKPTKYGSVFPMAYAGEKGRLVWARTRHLSEWLEGQPAEKIVGESGIGYFVLSGSQEEKYAFVANETKRADDTLNKVYNQILVIYSNNQLFIDKLVDSELAWIAFRDAELEAVRVVKDNRVRYGTLSSMAYEIEKARLTWARVEQLKEWSEGIPEGNVGAGSRRIRPW